MSLKKWLSVLDWSKSSGESGLENRYDRIVGKSGNFSLCSYFQV